MAIIRTTTMTNQFNTPSFRRDMKHLAQLMEQINMMGDANSIPVLADAITNIDLFIQTLWEYTNDAQAIRAEVKFNIEGLRVKQIKAGAQQSD